ncbi:ribose 5-phosphate isomerase A [Acidiphilium iwatense]|uniref:Ribose-5-phosphate isomerase A n=2 Tax=Acidiphilium iwatense TaxID=768198 RepID=A0ABS9DWX1_9PROT|nr:ribose 5-phosphate isomerase A [Acidiphilium iwatense]
MAGRSCRRRALGGLIEAIRMTTQDDQKRAAAREAAKLVEPGMRLGLGTGSTIAHFLDALAERVKTENIDHACVATSVTTERRAAELGIKVTALDGVLDLAVDGADEVEFGSLHLIKGLGGALLREKQIAESSHRFVVIADQGKLVSRLGERSKLPVEIVNFAVARTLARIGELGLLAEPRKQANGKAFISDNGNVIADCVLPGRIDAVALDRALKSIAGVVETGLFTAGCDCAIIGYDDGSTRCFEGDVFAKLGVSTMIATLRALRLQHLAHKPLLAVMGVSASGKSTIGAMLAGVLGVPFRDGDDLHPASNRRKMHEGKPLDDNDRMPWLHRIALELRGWRDAGSGGVIVSSLLTRCYRDFVRGGSDDVTLIHLDGDRDLLADRIANRHGHFMPAKLLDSQFATLELPGEGENAIVVKVDASPIEIVRDIVERLAARDARS